VLKKINSNYKDLLKEKDVLIKIIQVLMIVISEGFSIISIYKIMSKYLDNNIYIIIYTIIFSGVIYYLTGYILLISSNIYLSKLKNENMTLRADFLLSYFLITAYTTGILLFPKSLKQYFISEVIGVTISYLLNLKILFKIMKNPYSTKFDDIEASSFIRILIASIIVVAMILMDLFLGVCIINAFDGIAFSNTRGFLDLFYYTIVTFTTIGFGDIIPVTLAAKVMVIIISITSIICITIFLGSIYSFKDRC